MEQFDAYIFDFGGVLIEVDYLKTMDAFRAIGMKDVEKMYSQATQESLFDEFETGRISAQRFINEVLNFLPPGTSPNAVVAAWNAMIGSVPINGLSVLRSLKDKGAKVYMLSNTNEIHIPIAWSRWKKTDKLGPDSYFTKIYLSYEIGMRKPNAEIFERVIQEQNLDPLRTLFIDDSIQHIEGAARCGLQTHHLQQISDLYTIFS